MRHRSKAPHTHTSAPRSTSSPVLPPHLLPYPWVPQGGLERAAPHQPHHQQQQLAVDADRDQRHDASVRAAPQQPRLAPELSARVHR